MERPSERQAGRADCKGFLGLTQIKDNPKNPFNPDNQRSIIP